MKPTTNWHIPDYINFQVVSVAHIEIQQQHNIFYNYLIIQSIDTPLNIYYKYLMTHHKLVQMFGHLSLPSSLPSRRMAIFSPSSTINCWVTVDECGLDNCRTLFYVSLVILHVDPYRHTSAGLPLRCPRPPVQQLQPSIKLKSNVCCAPFPSVWRSLYWLHRFR